MSYLMLAMEGTFEITNTDSTIFQVQFHKYIFTPYSVQCTDEERNKAYLYIFSPVFSMANSNLAITLVNTQ